MNIYAQRKNWVQTLIHHIQQSVIQMKIFMQGLMRLHSGVILPVTLMGILRKRGKRYHIWEQRWTMDWMMQEDARSSVMTLPLR